jgi:hypothetical protein
VLGDPDAEPSYPPESERKPITWRAGALLDHHYLARLHRLRDSSAESAILETLYDFAEGIDAPEEPDLDTMSAPEKPELPPVLSAEQSLPRAVWFGIRWDSPTVSGDR